MNQPSASPKVLVAPLDWGLGHATRCIPLIRELIAQNCEVVIAASGKVKALLQMEFTNVQYLDLQGYEMKYAASAWQLPLKIVAQIPGLLSAIKMETAWLRHAVEQEGIEAVISDNRYGLHHPTITSVFITHQLLIRAPFKWIENALQKINYKFIDQFDECWIPDAEGDDNLAGDLSHPAKKPKLPLHFLGLLSRFANNEITEQGKYLLVLLSGPEPQRTVFENILLEDLKEYKGPVVFIRGLPVEKGQLHQAENVLVYNHLTAIELEQKIRGAGFVISRCGYSTVMDLAALKKKSILIPTPGQTEQEYLAKHLMQKNFALCIEQKRFRLQPALELANAFNYNLDTKLQSDLKTTVQSLIKKIKTKREALQNQSNKGL